MKIAQTVNEIAQKSLPDVEWQGHYDFQDEVRKVYWLAQEPRSGLPDWKERLQSMLETAKLLGDVALQNSRLLGEGMKSLQYYMLGVFYHGIVLTGGR